MDKTTRNIRVFGICTIYVMLSVLLYIFYSKNLGVFKVSTDIEKKGTFNKSILTNLTYFIKSESEDLEQFSNTKTPAKSSFKKEQEPRLRQLGSSPLFIYSVFYQPLRQGLKTSIVVAVGLALRTFRKTPVTCRITYEDISVDTVTVFVQFVHDNHPTQTNHTAVFVECPIDERKVPTLAAFTTDDQNPLELPVNQPGTHKSRQMTVCHGVLYGHYDDFNSLMQNVEFNRLMGAEHIFIYNQSAGPNVEKLLKYYDDYQGLVTVLQMEKVHADLTWYHGQQLAINDCIFRNRNVSEFVAVIDTDEYILPGHHRNWLEVIDFVTERELHMNQSASIGSFSFKHSLFCFGHANASDLRRDLNTSTELEQFLEDKNVDIILENFRGKMWPYPKRSKTIYRVDLVREAGIHFPMRMWKGAKVVVVDESVGFLEHHRHVAKTHCSIREHRNFPAFKEYINVLQRAYKNFNKYVKENTLDFFPTYV